MKTIRSKLDINELGKLPPQAVDLEQAVLGAIMLENDAISFVSDFLKPEHFYKEANKELYSAIIKLYTDSKEIDILTVTEQLRKQNKLDLVGGPYYIAELTANVSSSAHIDAHARIIVEKSIKRDLISISSEVQKKAYDDSNDSFDLVEMLESNLLKLTSNSTKSDVEQIQKTADKLFKTLQSLSQKKTELTGVPCGILSIDRKTSGWQKSDLIIIAARPGMGKTSFMLSAARNAAVDFNRPGMIFSLEMSKEQLVSRLCAAESEIDLERLRNGKIEYHEWETLMNKTSKMLQSKLYIDDTPGISVFELKSKAKRMMMKEEIGWIMVDYLQLMSGSGNKSGNREGEISEISRNLKALARELNIPILALSQLSRAVEARGGEKKPMLSDLRESGAIEQDADMVIFIYRPEYYGIKEFADGSSTNGVAVFIISKFRNGSPGEIETRFIHKFTKFTDLESDFQSHNLNANNKFPSNTIPKEFSEPNYSRDNDMPY